MSDWLNEESNYMPIRLDHQSVYLVYFIAVNSIGPLEPYTG